MFYMLKDQTKCQLCPFRQATFLIVFLSGLQLGYILSYYLDSVTELSIHEALHDLMHYTNIFNLYFFSDIFTLNLRLLTPANLAEHNSTV